MSQESCVLTTKDLTIIEVMRERCLGTEDPMRPLLDRKLASAKIIFREDAPPTLATIGSRVAYSANDGEIDTRILSHGLMNTPTGLYLPITTLRGLALLGLMEGQIFAFVNIEGQREQVSLHSLQYQPEAARRAMEASAHLSPSMKRRATFRVINGAKPPFKISRDGFDDPDPSAA